MTCTHTETERQADQHLAGPQSTDTQAVVREKVAREMYERKPFYSPFVSENSSGVLPWEKLGSYEQEDRRCDADAAISACLQALIEMELPKEAVEAILETPLVHSKWHPSDDDINDLTRREFQSALLVIQSLLTKEAN